MRVLMTDLHSVSSPTIMTVKMRPPTAATLYMRYRAVAVYMTVER